MKYLALFAVVGLFSGFASLAPSAAAEMQAEEDWFVLLNGEDRIGYMQTTETTAANGEITTGQAVKIVMSRAGTRMEIDVGSTFVESADGEPITANSTITMGGVPIVTEVEFGDKAMKVTSGQRGRTTTTMKRPVAGHWLPPAAMARYVEAQLAAGAQTIQTRTVDVSSGLTPIDMTMRVRGPQDVEVYGKIVPAIAWDATVSAMPGVTLREYVDDAGKSIKSTIRLMPGMEITVLRADKSLALSELTPAEMMAQTFVVPSRPIENPRALSGAVYRLKTKDGRALPTLPSVGVQTVSPGGRVAVGLSEAPRQEIDVEPYLRASPVLNHEDPAVQEWLEPLAAMTFTAPAAEPIAEWLRATVHQKIRTKDLSVGFATASDVARTKQGDCTEHAVLLAALLRGAGIPSRCVSGLVYADQFAGHEGIFGYHMWTQAWIAAPGSPDEKPQGRWVDFDATLPGGVRFDATHIALSVSDMNDGVMGNDMAALLPLLGNLEIEVVETVYTEAAGQ